MIRKVLCHNGRSALWTLWSQFRAVVNQKAPFTFGDAAYGDALRNAAQTLSAVLDGSVSFEPVDYNDQEFRFVRARAHKDVEREDDEGFKADPKYTRPRNLVVCEGSVAYLRDLAKRLYREDRITGEEAERFAAHLYAVIEGQKVRVRGDAGGMEAVVYESFTFRVSEYKLAPIVPGEPLVYKEDDVSWKRFLVAVARGERCEVDEEFYNYWLEVLPPIFMNQTVELADGTSRRVHFGAAEGDGVPIDAFWREGERCFAQRTKLRTRG